MTLKLHEYQKKAIKFALDKRASYMMIDIGLGKTAIALKVAQQLKKYDIPTVALAPLRVCHATWPDEKGKWTPELTHTVLHGSNKNYNVIKQRDLYLLNYDGLKWFYTACARRKFPLKKYFIVFDESSMLKNPSTVRFKKLRRLMPIFSQYRMNLSATPSPNGLHELWSQYYMLDEGKRLGYSYYSYREKYFFYTGAPQYRTTIKPGGADRIHKAIKDITFRLSAGDFLTSVPAITYSAIPLQLPSKLRKKYDYLEREFFLDFAEGTASVDSAVGLASKLRQFLQGGLYLDNTNKRYQQLHDLKLQALKELMEENEGHSILCPIQFRFELDMLTKFFGRKLPVIAGGIPIGESMRLVKQWNNGELPLLICHPRSISHGMNLQSGGHIIVWLALTWSLEEYLQLNGRLARQGQTKVVSVNHMIFKDTIDMILLQVLGNKDRTQQSFLNVLRKYSKLYV